MLRDVCEAQRVVRAGTDDLAEIRKMIQKTKVNIISHIHTVDNLKTSLVNICEKSKGVLENSSKFPAEGGANFYGDPVKNLKKGQRNSQSQKQLSITNTHHSGSNSSSKFQMGS